MFAFTTLCTVTSAPSEAAFSSGTPIPCVIMIQMSVLSFPSSKGTHLATLLLLLAVQGSGSSFSDRDIQGFSDFLDGVITCRGVTGGVVTLVKDERVVLTKSFGYYDLEKRRKTTVNTRFFIGSLTKAFTSAVIAKLLAEHHR